MTDRQPDSGGVLPEMASVSRSRTTSLKIFDRSFAVTYWLQGVAIAIGLLVHLGLTRRQILTVVAGEGAAWTVIGAFAGLALGLWVSTMRVFVVNPQSFHWTMDLQVPWAPLVLLCAAVVAAAGRDAVQRQVKENW